METPSQLERRFVRRGLPWVIGGIGLAVYLATLNHWVTLPSLRVTAEVNGWVWQPIRAQPVLFLLTRPLTWLPESQAALALNVFSAVTAALTLALLARSVALLLHERWEGQPPPAQNAPARLPLPQTWCPVVLAALALGLQLSFWQHATAGSAEMLDLLLFASPIWCLLEYRLDQRRRWLDWTAMLCGVAAANSWAMAGFLPLFGVALVGSNRFRFFNAAFLGQTQLSEWKAAAPALGSDLRFFLRMALFGLAGLLLFLLPPLAQGFASGSPVGPRAALAAAAHSYWASLSLFGSRIFFRHREIALVLAAVSLAPMLILSLRWRASTGCEFGPRPHLKPLAFCFAHLGLLLLGLWVTLDPPFSPGQIGRRLGLTLPFLPLYYLGALGIGYYSGFLLVRFSDESGRPGIVQGTLQWVVPKLVHALTALTLLGLLLKNGPAIRATNGPELAEYARLALRLLPPEGAVLLSEDPTRLALLEAALVRDGRRGRYLAVDVNALPLEPYRAWLRKKYPGTWPESKAAVSPPSAGGPLPAADPPPDANRLLRLITQLTQSNRVFYAHPGFGFVPEFFYLQPRGLLFELKPYPAHALDGPLPAPGELAENRDFWERALGRNVASLADARTRAGQPPSSVAGRLLERVHANTSLPDSQTAPASWYASALNCWGVTLQKNGQWSEAARCFTLAGELDPDNLSAPVNLRCNRDVVAGKKLTLAAFGSNEEQFRKYRNWNQVLTRDGPFDDPTHCYELSVACAQQNLWRQAGQQLERVLALAPGEVTARLAWGHLLNRWRRPDRALQVAAEIQADPGAQPLPADVKVELGFLEAEAWFGKTNPAKAAGVLEALLDSRPGDAALLDRAEAFFTAHGSYPNALRIADQQLRSTPDQVSRLMDKGLLCLLAGEFSNAVPPFTRVVSLTNSYDGRINRALAYLRVGALDQAEADYQEALRALPSAYQPYYGLGEVARAKGDTNAAIRYYRQYLERAPSGSGEAKNVAGRLGELQPATPAPLSEPTRTPRSD